MKILSVKYEEDLLKVICSKMEETLSRYNLKYEDLDKEMLDTFTKLSEYSVTLSLNDMRIREQSSAWRTNAHLLPYEDNQLNRINIVGKSNKDNDTDCIRINCLLTEIYYLLAQFLPHTDCMGIIKEHLPLIKELTGLTNIASNFQVQELPDSVLEEHLTSDNNALKDCLEELEKKHCPIKYISYDGKSLVMATKTKAYVCWMNHFVVKAFAKTSSKHAYGKSKTELESMSNLDKNMINSLIESHIPSFYAYALISSMAYLCILLGGGINMIPTNTLLYGTVPSETLVKYFVNLYKTFK